MERGGGADVLHNKSLTLSDLHRQPSDRLRQQLRRNTSQHLQGRNTSQQVQLRGLVGKSTARSRSLWFESWARDVDFMKSQQLWRPRIVCARLGGSASHFWSPELLRLILRVSRAGVPVQWEPTLSVRQNETQAEELGEKKCIWIVRLLGHITLTWLEMCLKFY